MKQVSLQMSLISGDVDTTIIIFSDFIAQGVFIPSSPAIHLVEKKTVTCS